MKTRSTPIPHGFRVLADAAGCEAAVTICLEHGGSRIYVPKQANDTELAGLVGLDAARKIVDVAAGCQLEIPLSNRVVAAELIAAGWTQDKVARRLRISRRTVQRWGSDDEPKFPLLDALDAS